MKRKTAILIFCLASGLSGGAYAQKASSSIPGLAYASSTAGSTVTGSNLLVIGNTAINTTVIGGFDLDTVGSSFSSSANATINSIIVDASRVTGSNLVVMGNTAINTLVAGKATAVINSIIVR